MKSLKKITTIFFILLIAFLFILWLYHSIETKMKSDAEILEKFIIECKAETNGYLREDKLGEIIIKMQYYKKGINKSLDPIVKETCPKAAIKFISRDFLS